MTRNRQSSVERANNVREAFRETGSVSGTIHYIDLVRGFQEMGCLGQSYLDCMKEKDITRLSQLWGDLCEIDHLVQLVVYDKPSQYQWVFASYRQTQSSMTKHRKTRSTLSSTRTNTQLSQNYNTENNYVRKRVNKICDQFKKSPKPTLQLILKPNSASSLPK